MFSGNEHEFCPKLIASENNKKDIVISEERKPSPGLIDQPWNVFCIMKAREREREREPCPTDQNRETPRKLATNRLLIREGRRALIENARSLRLELLVFFFRAPELLCEPKIPSRKNKKIKGEKKYRMRVTREPDGGRFLKNSLSFSISLAVV